MKATDEWKDIPGFTGLYKIHGSGKVYSFSRSKLLKIWMPKDNRYPSVSLSMGNKTISRQIHRLLAVCFIPNPLNKLYVNHKDGNKRNFSLDNLEWCTMSENQIHAIKTGLARVPVLPLGDKHPASKITSVDVEMIRVVLRHDFTQEQIAARFGITSRHVSAIKLNKTWKHLTP